MDPDPLHDEEPPLPDAPPEVADGAGAGDVPAGLDESGSIDLAAVFEPDLRRRRRAGGRLTEEAPHPAELPPPPEPGPVPSPRRREAAAKRLEKQILARLNPEQARAVTTTDGPVLILAGAGSGKTRVLAHRVAYLVGVRGVRPWQILAVTFTNRAAGELRERIIALVGEAGRDVQAGTFHALCARVLRAHGEAIGLRRDFVIYDTDDQQALMKQILRDEDLPAKGEYRPSAILGAISAAKNEMVDPTEVSVGPGDIATHRRREIARLARLYEQRLRTAGALDFDDLLLWAVRLFEEAPGVVTRYQERWRYLHVDEYQDTNRPQYLWIRALAARHHNLCVVGDDDQSIYSWRGADVRNILDFERDYPDATVVKLERNYRSTQLILDAAHAVVSRNEARTDKKLWTDIGGGVPIQLFEAYSEDEEAEWIARKVEELIGGRGSLLTRRADEDETVRAQDVAVMYRTNAQRRASEESFLRYWLRYQLVGGTRFYQRREVKDALAYLRVLRSDTDVVSFERILNVPARGIGERTIEALRQAATAREGSTWAAITTAAAGDVPAITARARSALAGFATVVGRLRTRIGVLALPELLDAVLEESGYRAMLADGSEEGEERWANLLELRSVTTRYDDLEPGDALDRLLEETALVADQDSYEGGADAVTLITLHAAKGLEFPVVFIAGLEEGLFPTGRALDAEAQVPPDPRSMEEERRLAYVGITRAKRRLYLSHAMRRFTRGFGEMAMPSRFLFDIPAELMVGPRLVPADDDTPDGPLDLDLVFGRRRTSRFGTPIRAGGGAYREGSGTPGAPAPGRAFRAERDLAARREAFEQGARSGSLRRPAAGWSPWDEPPADAGADERAPGAPGPAAPGAERPIVPGERRFRDGDRVRHGRFGDGIVVSSRLTRSDEEVKVAFRDGGVKTLLASIAGLEILG